MGESGMEKPNPIKDGDGDLKFNLDDEQKQYRFFSLV